MSIWIICYCCFSFTFSFIKVQGSQAQDEARPINKYGQSIIGERLSIWHPPFLHRQIHEAIFVILWHPADLCEPLTVRLTLNLRITKIRVKAKVSPTAVYNLE